MYRTNFFELPSFRKNFQGEKFETLKASFVGITHHVSDELTV